MKEEEGVRFALGVPLISNDYHTIGILLVLDGSPRDSVKDTDRDDKSLLASCFVWSEDGLYAGNNHRDISDYHVLGSFLSHNVGQLKMQNKDAEQRKFMSNFSHELRTPINVILGSAQFLQDTVSDDYQNELLQSIVVSSNTLLDTLNIVLDYTKFEHAVTEVENPSAEEGA